ncbi:sigma-70 family RNA polymerase sigma factor [Leptolyngbya sp. NIES-2104]|uniref:sigma-70 family RNA polymerase sigma factor n=1 Tax=Leptolyngbya sp. NIES-2104 TaxID=1552121 RepID=UPI0006ECA879|nr:sigma-70 family RNA polymerase sigma factor [Leptolyngbya sp. NIES-2104]GAP96943.1 RNA polymerase sigma-70 factor [Leptolyngbya sp. NIES-2104]
MTIEPASDDFSLIKRIAQQDQAAMATLYDRYAPTLYAVAFQTLGSVQESEEVVLDVFAQVWRTAIRFEAAKTQVDTWLFIITRSHTLARLRTMQQTEKTSIVVEASMSSVTSDPLQDVLISERRDQIQAALAQLSAEQRQVIELAHYQGLSHSEIATQLELPLGTVKTRIRLGLHRLRIALNTWKPS